MSGYNKRVLIYRLGSLGDTVIALPCFHKVRQSFPLAEITLLTNRPVTNKAAPIETILGAEYFFDRVMDYPLGTRDPKVLLSLIKQIRTLRIDTVINLSAARSKASSIRDQLFFRAAGVKNLMGFSRNIEDLQVCIDLATGQYEWEAKRLSRRIKKLGNLDLEDINNWDLRLTTNELKESDEIIGNLYNSKPIIVISLGTKVQSNDWEDNNWINLVASLNRTLKDWSLVVIGASEEATRADNCLNAWSGAGINVCGKTSPRVSAAILKRARLFIGHDSGPMHLAACVGVPCVAIFAARNLQGQWYPRGGDNNKIIYHHTDCEGCGLATCIVQKKKCILSITVEEVEKAVMEILRVN